MEGCFYAALGFPPRVEAHSLCLMRSGKGRKAKSSGNAHWSYNGQVSGRPGPLRPSMTSRGPASLPQMTVGRMPSSTLARYLWPGAAPFRLVSGCPTGSGRMPRVGQRRWPSSQRLGTEGDRPSPPSSEPRPQPGRHSRPAARSVAWGRPESQRRPGKAALVRKVGRQGRDGLARLDHQPSHQPVYNNTISQAHRPARTTRDGVCRSPGCAVQRQPSGLQYLGVAAGRRRTTQLRVAGPL